MKDKKNDGLVVVEKFNQEYERQELTYDGITIVGNVIPLRFGSFSPYTFHRPIPSKTHSFLNDFQQTNFISLSVEILSIDHPIYGKISKNDIGHPFLMDSKGKKLKRSSWKLSKIQCGSLVLEKELKQGLFKRKIYKFV